MSFVRGSIYTLYILCTRNENTSKNYKKVKHMNCEFIGEVETQEIGKLVFIMIDRCTGNRDEPLQTTYIILISGSDSGFVQFVATQYKWSCARLIWTEQNVWIDAITLC